MQQLVSHPVPEGLQPEAPQANASAQQQIPHSSECLQVMLKIEQITVNPDMANSLEFPLYLLSVETAVHPIANSIEVFGPRPQSLQVLEIQRHSECAPASQTETPQESKTQV